MQSQTDTIAEQAAEQAPKRRLTSEQGAQVDRRITELCAQGASGLEVAATINKEVGVDLSRGSYADRVRRLGLAWIPASRRPPIPDIPEAELPVCKWCGQVRMPVRYAFGGGIKAGQQTLLCENRCCPDPTCGAKLELHSVGKERDRGGKRKYWAHALPLPLRKCEVCGNEFTPENIKGAHRMACDACAPNFASRKYKAATRAANPEKLRMQDKAHWERRKAQQTTNKKVRPLSKETAARITAYACLSIQNVSNWDKGPLMYPKQNIRDNAYKSVVEFAKPRRYKAKTDAERRRIELLSAVERQSELRAALSTIKAAT